MSTRENAEKLRRETERIRTSRLERERGRAEQEGAAERREREVRVSEQNHTNRNHVHETARQLDGLKDRLLWLRECLENWEERNARFRDAAARETIGHLAAVGGLAGCIAVDTVVLTLPSRIVSRGFRESIQPTLGDAGWVVPLIAFVFSTSYLALEFFIGDQLGRNLKPALHPISDRAFAVVAWVTLPVLTFAYTLINSGVLSNDPLKVMGPATVAGGIGASLALGIVALVAHGAVLYYSDAISDGFAFKYYKVTQLIIRFRINRTGRKVRRAVGDAEIAFLRFAEDFRHTNSDGGRDAGLFSETATHAVNDIFGREVIEESTPRGSGRGEDRGRGGAAHDRAGAPNKKRVVPNTPADDAGADRGGEPFEPDASWSGFNWEDEDEVRG